MRSRCSLVLALALGGLLPAAAGATLKTVQIIDGPLGSFDFSPRWVFINRGDTVKWVNNTAQLHTATGGITPTPDGSSPINSPFLGTGGTYQTNFLNTGFFRYFCQAHPDMTGMVRVGKIFISIKDFSFNPSTFTVGVGDTVIWRNDGSFTHTSKSGTPPTGNGIWNSGNLGPGGTFQRIPGAAGSFPFFCNIHNSMTGTMTVNAGQLADAGGSGAARTRLLAARPNPARREVRLGFDLAAAGPARLTLTDASGRAVAKLVDGELEAGHHDVTWDGRSASGARVGAGVYYYRLEAGSFAQTRRFTWVR